MEYRRRQCGVRAAFREDALEIFGLAGAAGCDDGDVRDFGDGAGQLTIETGLDAVGIHGREQDFACSQNLALQRPLHGIDAFVVTASAGEDVPPSGSIATRIDGKNHRLRAKFLAQFGNQLGTAHSCGIDAHLFGARQQDAARVRHRSDAAPDRERYENLTRGAGDDVRHDVAGIARRGDVEEDQFVGALLVVAIRELYRVARVAQTDEMHAFDDTASGDVEARDDPFGQHGQSSTKLRTMPRPSGPDFSGWNCTPKTLFDSSAAVNGTV